jgi:hypothetical protein
MVLDCFITSNTVKVTACLQLIEPQNGTTSKHNNLNNEILK